MTKLCSRVLFVFLVGIVLCLAWVSDASAQTLSSGASRKVILMGICKWYWIPNDPAQEAHRMVIGSGASMEEANANLLENCLHSGQNGESVERIVKCPEGYYAAAYSFGFCGSRTVKAAILGLAKQFSKTAAAGEKHRGIDDTFAGGIQLGLLTSSKNTEIYCDTIGSDTNGNIFPRDLKFGTGQASCYAWNFDVNQVAGRCSGNDECFPYIASNLKPR